jgi:ATP-dependent protease ClpP protease subunit
VSDPRPLKVRIGVPERRGASNAASVTRVDVYDDIGDGGWLGNGITAQDFVSQISGIKGDLDVHIQSCGGDCFDGIAIANAIRDHKGRVTTVVDGIAASIASVIMQAGAERVVAPGSMVMIHDAFGGCVGDASEMSKMSQTLDKVSDNIASIYASRSGYGSPQTWRDAMKTETWYTAEEAVAAKLADQLGGAQAQIPEGLDLAALGTVPGRIAAQLRSIPVAKPAEPAPQPQDAARHDPMKGTHSHPHPAYASQGGDAMHSHEHSHDGDANHSHSHTEPDGGEADGAQDSATGQDCPVCKGTGKIDEGNRQCPDCGGTGKKSAAKGASDQQVTLSLDGDGSALGELFVAWFRENTRVHGAAGKPGTHGDHERFDPDGDGDCDACPEGDTDHDYWTAAGKQLKSVPGKPMPAGDALTEERIRAIIREEMAGGGAPQFAAKIPDAVKSQFVKDLKNDSPTDIAAGMRRLSQWAGSGHYPTGTTYDDLKWFYDQCAKELKSRDPDSDAGGNFPPKSSDHLETPLDAGGDPGIRNCHALVTALAAIREAAGGDSSDSAGDGPEDKTEPGLSGTDLEQIRTAFKALKGATT